MTAALGRLPSSSRVELPRLSPREVVELLQDAFRSNALAERLGVKIAYKSDGVPFFVFEMIRSLKDERFIEELPDGTFTQSRIVDEIEVPSVVRDLVRGRLADVSKEERLDPRRGGRGGLRVRRRPRGERPGPQARRRPPGPRRRRTAPRDSCGRRVGCSDSTTTRSARSCTRTWRRRSGSDYHGLLAEAYVAREGVGSPRRARAPPSWPCITCAAPSPAERSRTFVRRSTT